MAALGLAVVGLATFFLAWSGNHAAPPSPSNRQLTALEARALHRLKLPSGSTELVHGCMARRCYVAALSSTQVAAEMPGLLRTAGFQRPGQLRTAEPVGMLRQAHWSTNTGDPLVIACKTINVAGKGPMTECQDAGRIGQTLVNVLVMPFQPCSSTACADPRRAEVLTWAAAYPTSA